MKNHNFTRRRIPAHKRGHDWRYRQLRPAILERDAYTCQMRLRGCTGRATTVDCIRPYSQGGDTHDPNNLRAACLHCNRLAGQRLGAAIRNRTQRLNHSEQWG